MPCVNKSSKGHTPSAWSHICFAFSDPSALFKGKVTPEMKIPSPFTQLDFPSSTRHNLFLTIH